MQSGNVIFKLNSVYKTGCFASDHARFNLTLFHAYYYVSKTKFHASWTGHLIPGCCARTKGRRAHFSQ